ncbi:MAG: hypothetical protein ACOC2Y_02835 [Spirochaetota bacterium]
MERRRVLVACAAVAMLVVGCEWMGYTAYQGSWTYAIETEEEGTIVVEQRELELADTAFTVTDTVAEDATVVSEVRFRGDLAVAGRNMYFTTTELWLPEIMRLFLMLAAEAEGGDLEVFADEWMNLDEFVAAVEGLDFGADEFPREALELGDATFRVSGDTLTLSDAAGSIEYSKL